MKINFSWDDGTIFDLKMMQLLKKYHFKSIFYIPLKSWGYENLELYKGFEIGGHTYSHPQDLKLLSDEMLKVEITVAKELLEKKWGKKIEWFCYPRGRFNDKVKQEVKRAGYLYARTTNIKNGFDKFEMGGLHCYNRKEYNGVDWLEYIKNYIKGHQFKIINIWGHSEEINRNGDWDKLELLFQYINENSNLK